MFDSLLLHETTIATLSALAAAPPQGLLLVGPQGVGKKTVAMHWAQQVTPEPGAVRIVSPDEKGTLTIEVIRDLYKATRNRQQGRQVVILTEIDGMSIEAENAFLKLLEEPRSGLTFILTASSTEPLLPTILSRVQQVPLQPLPDEAIRRAIVAQKPGIAQADLAQIVFLANGRPGTALGLLNAESFETQKQTAQLAKQLLTVQPYERYLQIGVLARDRHDCLMGLSAMQRIVEVQLRSSKNIAQVTHWSHLANLLDTTLAAIRDNGNMRAQLLHLFSSY